MGQETAAVAFLRSHGLGDIDWIADPKQELYREFHLASGTPWQLLGPKAGLRAIGALLKGHGMGRPDFDATQMPGAFVLLKGKVLASYRYSSIADRPDYVGLVKKGLSHVD